MTSSVRYFAALFFVAGMIGIFPLTMRAQNDTEKTQIRKQTTPQDLLVHSEHPRGFETRIFRVSAYCPCSTCTSSKLASVPIESGLRRTASGYRLKPDGSDSGRICAAPRNYPFGTRFDIPGIGVVVAEDRGGSIKAAGDTVAGKILVSDRLDVLFKTHREAKEFGVKYLEVKVIYEQ
jgi:3D (Asp-Asp-Asp) domain-containing protein